MKTILVHIIVLFLIGTFSLESQAVKHDTEKSSPGKTVGLDLELVMGSAYMESTLEIEPWMRQEMQPTTVCAPAPENEMPLEAWMKAEMKVKEVLKPENEPELEIEKWMAEPF
jgi:hypothetical protein